MGKCLVPQTDDGVVVTPLKQDLLFFNVTELLSFYDHLDTVIVGFGSEPDVVCMKVSPELTTAELDVGKLIGLDVGC